MVTKPQQNCKCLTIAVASSVICWDILVNYCLVWSNQDFSSPPQTCFSVLLFCCGILTTSDRYYYTALFAAGLVVFISSQAHFFL
eukprot:m.170627 g.170627  ORF g.170627 m.170627 type:complete len:85 (-) comp16487_c4_seq2:1931-2185(-)